MTQSRYALWALAIIFITTIINLSSNSNDSSSNSSSRSWSSGGGSWSYGGGGHK